MSTLSVQVNGQSHPVEAVGPDSTFNGSFIVFRLPDLPPGTNPLGIRVRGVNSINTPHLIIVESSSNAPSASRVDELWLLELLFPFVELLL